MPIGKASLWRHRDFLLLWSGQVIDQFGTQVSRLAVPLVAILTLHASKFGVAALAAAGALPMLLVSLPAGAVVDRIRRRPLMIACALGSAAAMASVPLCSMAGRLTLAQLYVVSIIVGAFGVFFDSAAVPLPLVLLGRDRLLDGNARMNTGRGLAELAGPSAGGFLIGLVGAARAVGIDACSYLAGALTLVLMRFREPKPEARPREACLASEIHDGLRLLLTNGLLRAMVLAIAVAAFLLAGINAIWLLYVVKELGWSPQAAGLVYGLSLIGGVLGGAVARRLIDRIGMSRAVILGALLSAPLETVTALVPRGLCGQLIVTLAFTSLTAAGMVNMTATMSVRQLICPPEMLGRMTATNRFLTQGLRFLGPLAAGGLGVWAGLRVTLLVFGVLTLISPLILALSPIRTMREVPVHEAYAA